MTQDISTTAEATEASALPRAKAVHSDPAQCGNLETAPLPKAATRRKLEDKSPAEWAYERLILYIQNFEAQLDADQEVAAALCIWPCIWIMR